MFSKAERAVSLDETKGCESSVTSEVTRSASTPLEGGSALDTDPLNNSSLVVLEIVFCPEGLARNCCAVRLLVLLLLLVLLRHPKSFNEIV